MFTNRPKYRFGSAAILSFSVLVIGAAPALTAGTGTVHTQQASERTIAPDVIVPHRPHWREGEIEVKNVEVDIDVVDHLSTVHMAVTLYNPSRTQREAQLVLPVPGNAVIRAFGVDAISQEPNAVLMPRDEATKLYREIVRKMVDPGLLEFVGTGLIRSSVFPLEAGGTQTFRVTYEYTVSAESGRMDLVLARSESVDAARVPWSIAMRIRSARGIGVIYSPTHDIHEDRLGASDVKLKVRDSQVPGPVRVSYVLGASTGTSVTAMLYPDERLAGGEGGYFILIVEAPDDIRIEHLKREVTLVFDRSGSMRGDKMEQARSAALQVIEALDDGEYFNIIDYSDTIARFAPKPVEKNAQSIAAVRQYIAAMRAMGGTNIHDALLEALSSEPSPDALPMVLFLTDGVATVGPTRETIIREAAARANVHKRRIFTFGVGNDVNAPLLSGLANGSRAVATFVTPQEDVEVKVGQVFAKLHGPVLVDPALHEIRVDLAVGHGSLREVMPRVLPDIFAGEQMIVVGQYTSSEPVRVEIVGMSAGKEHRIAAELVPQSASRGNAFIARLWAQRKIGTLLDALRQRSADPAFTPNDPAYKELVGEIVALSKEHGILTEYTAFIALEDQYRPMAGDKAGDYTPHFVGAREDRVGADGVRQEVEVQRLMVTGRSVAPASGVQYRMSAGGLPGVEYVAPEVRTFDGLTFYRRSGRWVEASLLDTPDAEPSYTVEFDSVEFDELMDYLITRGQQGVLALDADVLLKIKDKVVLVRCVR